VKQLPAQHSESLERLSVIGVVATLPAHHHSSDTTTNFYKQVYEDEHRTLVPRVEM